MIWKSKAWEGALLCTSVALLGGLWYASICAQPTAAGVSKGNAARPRRGAALRVSGASLRRGARSAPCLQTPLMGVHLLPLRSAVLPVALACSLGHKRGEISLQGISARWHSAASAAPPRNSQT